MHIETRIIKSSYKPSSQVMDFYMFMKDFSSYKPPQIFPFLCKAHITSLKDCLKLVQ